MSDRWEKRKKRFLARIERDLSTGYLDIEMLDLIKVINNNPNMYTTSSCSGRVVLMMGSQPWKKRNSMVLGKWHNGVSYEEVSKLMKSYNKGSSLWLILQSPILHVVCRNVDLAISLVRLARNCGFRYSTIISRGDYGFLAELMGSERLDAPLTLEGKKLIGEEELKVLVDYLNSKLRSSKAKIRKLQKALTLLNKR